MPRPASWRPSIVSGLCMTMARASSLMPRRRSSGIAVRPSEVIRALSGVSGTRTVRARGVEQNDSEAVRWYRTAAQAGDPGAQYDLARMCEDGRGTRENASEALRLFQAAAEQRDADAQCNLAVKYAHGWGGLSQDVREALRWFRRAAEQGDADALLQSRFHVRHRRRCARGPRRG